MTSAHQKFGLSCALSSPVTASGAPDLARLVAHARWVLANGADSITLFGTTGEGASFGLGDRQAMIDAVLAAGIGGKQLNIGIAAASIEEAVGQARQAKTAGATHLLLAPPFYFKGVSDDGLFGWFSRFIGLLGADILPIIAYHIPSVTSVALSSSLIGRLKTAFPGIIAGLKDSSGSWETQAEFLKDHARDLAVLVGDERQLAKSIALGGQGTICGLANFAPDLLRPVVHEGRDDPRIAKLVEIVCSYPVLPAVKVLVGHIHGDASYRPMLPPLEALDEASARALTAAFDAAKVSA